MTGKRRKATPPPSGYQEAKQRLIEHVRQMHGCEFSKERYQISDVVERLNDLADKLDGFVDGFSVWSEIEKEHNEPQYGFEDSYDFHTLKKRMVKKSAIVGGASRDGWEMFDKVEGVSTDSKLPRDPASSHDPVPAPDVCFEGTLNALRELAASAARAAENYPDMRASYIVADGFLRLRYHFGLWPLSMYEDGVDVIEFELLCLSAGMRPIGRHSFRERLRKALAHWIPPEKFDDQPGWLSGLYLTGR